MKEQKKTKNSGITLIALVVTIIVLLLLAGISIQMLSGNNGILQRAGEAKDETIHAQVNEQMQMDNYNYVIAHNTGETTSTLIEYLRSKNIIADEVQEGVWKINIENLLGSKQALGNGNYVENENNDVYVLEKDESNETYKVLYYEKNTPREIGLLKDAYEVSDIKKLQDFFDKYAKYQNEGNEEELSKVITQSQEGIYFKIDENSTATVLGVIYEGNTYTSGAYIIEYNGYRYKVPFTIDEDSGTLDLGKVEKTNITDYELIYKARVERSADIFLKTKPMGLRDNVVICAINGKIYYLKGDIAARTFTEVIEKEFKIPEIDGNEKRLYIGNSEFIYDDFNLETNDVISLFSSNESIVEVKENGIIYGKSEGEAMITITEKSGETKTIKVIVSTFGYNPSVNCFIGKKSIGKSNEKEIDNNQKKNPTEDEAGYKFETGYFIYVEDFSYDIFVDNQRVETVGNVVLCWDSYSDSQYDIFSLSGEWLGCFAGYSM